LAPYVIDLFDPARARGSGGGRAPLPAGAFDSGELAFG